MRGVAIFSGTTEGRTLSHQLAADGIPVTVCVATDYGQAEQGQAPGITVHTGRLEPSGMAALVAGASLCVDATHPYAAQASANIRAACEQAGVAYLRLLRPASPLPENALTASDAAEAARLLADTEGNILLTTGAKELTAFAPLGGQRLIARVLPSHAGLNACEAAGIPAHNIIAMQGPFTREMNQAILRQFSVRYLVTKDGGAAGGFDAKAEAARAAGATLVVIRRPADAGASYRDVLELCRKAGKPCSK